MASDGPIHLQESAQSFFKVSESADLTSYNILLNKQIMQQLMP